MTSPLLTYNFGYPWISQGNISFKGFYFDDTGVFFEGRPALQRFDNVSTPDTLRKVLSGIDGSFSVMIQLSEGLLAATDSMAMFPLFYAHDNQAWLVADNAVELKKRIRGTGSAINTRVVAEFESAGFVLGRNTLINGIFRTRAGEIVWLKHDGTSESVRYTHFLPAKFYDMSAEALANQLQDKLLTACKKLIASLNGQTLVVPLSGGYDSRLIACMLKQAGYENVICFTYGRPNPESVLSQQVATKLGYPWIFVNYDSIHTDNYLLTKTFLNYADYAGNAASMPYLQEYFGVKHLFDNKLIPQNSIFLPGHSGDFLGGSYVEKTANVYSNADLSAHIAGKYFWFLPQTGTQKHALLTRLNDWFGSYTAPDIPPTDGYCPWVEDWDVNEKLAKFIFNSAHVFPYFGFGVRFPLWDKALREFFRHVPYRYRSHKALYDKVLEERYFVPLGVYFGDKELHGRVRHEPLQRPPQSESLNKRGRQWVTDCLAQYKCMLSCLRKNVKQHMPFYLIERNIKRNDWICYARFTREMLHEMHQKRIRTPQRFNSYNALICKWYISRVADITK